MNRRFRPLFLVATLAGVLIAGCGGGSHSTTTSTTTTVAKTSKTTAASTTTQSTSSSVTSASTTTSQHTSAKVTGTNLGALSGGTVSADCDSALAAAPTISATEKAQLKSYCAALAHDNPMQLKAAEKTLCTDILSSIPAAYRSIAKAECSKL